MNEAVIRVAGLSKSYVTAAGLFPALKAQVPSFVITGPSTPRHTRIPSSR